ncbi:DUF1573 domain-containing protein [Pontibacter cellulosilyticus]|uniref:DUF1573 domain-containing protein n=1 Tax=Pontibacter cellulosilyticus TaxID=1720253 RepID=A0A923N3T2_9BACT|nr:DUF1573 domain-containing protein [Pontibacter cellulosilyticus]MBC5992370.1 DUF1573 domain-containing protein [Pontibacter cellulosilyticus]
MKRNLYLLLLLCFIFVVGTANAQGELKFEKETHDFGTIAEGTQAAYEFKVKNVGNQPVIISAVQPSCGCTTPDWTKDPILPGKTGVIRAMYNSTGRPGPFHKSISVTSNAATPNQVLYIKGEVGPKDLKTSYTPEQKAMSPRLAVGSTSYNFGKLEKGQKAVAKFTVKNTGKQPLVIQGVKTACNCVSFQVSQPSLKPGQTATLELTYVPMMLKEQNEVVTIISNDIVMPDLKLTLKANVVESLASKNMLREGNQPVPFR